MCKHKSGGMSRPSATANQTENIASNNNAASCDNEQLGDEASSTSSSQQENNPLHLQLISSSSSSSSIQDSSETRLLLLDISPNMGVQSAENSVGRELCGVQQMTLNSASSTKVNTSSYKWNEMRRDNESDEDHVSEKSPMLGSDWNSPLLEKSCDLPAVCICDGTLNSYIDFGRSCNNFLYASCSEQNDKHKPEFMPYNQYNIPESLLPKSFRNLKGGGCAVVEKDFIELSEENIEEIELSSIHGCDCNSKSEKKWLFSRHKCHSLDSSTKPTKIRISNSGLNKSRSLAQNISLRPMENIEESSLEKSFNDDYSFPPSENFVNDSSVAGPSQIQRPSSIHGVSENAKEYEEEEFRSRSFSLTPTINFAIFESESSSDTEESIEHEPEQVTSENYSSVMSGEKSCMPQTIGLSLPIINRTLPGCPSAAQLSLASSLGDGPICKICHMSAKDGDQLISPCRCAGTMQYIHCGCLMRWLEISSKKSRKPPSCELCQYQYQWHKKFKVRHWQFPHCSRRDKILHFLFFISVIVMVTCATITIMCFKQDKGTRVDPDRTELTQSEIVTLVCGVLFFLAFFVAMYVEVKARNTIYKLLAKFIYLNQQWYIDEYDKKDSAPVAV